MDQLLALLTRGWNKANGALKSPLFDLTPFSLVPDLVHNFGKYWTVVEYTETVDGAITIIFAAYRIDDICDSATNENCDETCKFHFQAMTTSK